MNADTFWRNIKRTPSGCWEWQRYRAKTNYGFASFNGGRTGTHRIAWTLVHGEIPKGMHVLHKCDNPPCCNPSHLFIGTHSDNHQDKKQKGRGANQFTGQNICSRGHALTDENTFGKRACNTCRNLAARNRRALNLAAMRIYDAEYRKRNRERSREKHRRYRAKKAAAAKHLVEEACK